ncbi:hypothetical protein FB446DRAFT_738908 [Lentinula raphanica]|nr:hypothetical protein FB446DRAFT_738908 [Lentinula raphanica]
MVRPLLGSRTLVCRHHRKAFQVSVSSKDPHFRLSISIRSRLRLPTSTHSMLDTVQVSPNFRHKDDVHQVRLGVSSRLREPGRPQAIFMYHLIHHRQLHLSHTSKILSGPLGFAQRPSRLRLGHKNHQGTVILSSSSSNLHFMIIIIIFTLEFQRTCTSMKHPMLFLNTLPRLPLHLFPLPYRPTAP